MIAQGGGGYGEQGDAEGEAERRNAAGGAKGARGAGEGRVGRSLTILSEATREGGDDVAGEGERGGLSGEDVQGDAGVAGDTGGADNRQVRGI